MDYFLLLEDILLTSKPKDKIEKFRLFYNNFLNGDFIMNKSYIPYTLDKPSYHTFLEIINFPLISYTLISDFFHSGSKRTTNLSTEPL